MKRYFITGTDTNCGKTYVCCTLLKHFQKKRQPALAIKPISTGVESDVLELQKHNPPTEQTICRWSFRPPIAPHLAAEAAGERIFAQEISAFCQDPCFNGYDPLLIEGAGGLMVPLNPQETWIDFLKISQIPILLVVGIRLGCINHALLSNLAIQIHGLPYRGWIANCLDPEMAEIQSNIKTIEQKMSAPLLGTISFGGMISESDQFLALC